MKKHAVVESVTCDTCGMGYLAELGRVCGDRSRFYLDGCKGKLVRPLPRSTRIILNAFRDLQAAFAKQGKTLPQPRSVADYRTAAFAARKATR